MQAPAQAVTIRRATVEDASGVLRLASKFVARSPFSRFSCFDPEVARDSLLRMLDGGACFIAVAGDQIVGGIAGILTPLWFSRDVVAAELGWWVDGEFRGHGEDLRRAFEAWGREAGVSTIVMSDIVLDDATPAGTLYERAGYEMVERSWMKGVN